jgi:regulator of replication initiation timing
LKLIAPHLVAEREKKEISDSFAGQQIARSQQQVAGLQKKEDNTMQLRRSKRIENKNLQARLPQNVVRRSQRITKLPVHLVPAVPIQIQNKYLVERRSQRITKVQVVQ